MSDDVIAGSGGARTHRELEQIQFETIDAIVRDLRDHPVERAGSIYHPIPFPEFDGLTTSSNRAEAERKFGFIVQVLKTLRPGGVEGARVLDIGANAGYYTFSLDQLGATVTSFESHPRYASIGRFLAQHKARHVAWHGEPFDISKIPQERFDLALMLSVFQWMADGGGRIDAASEELLHISEASDALIFELGFNSGRSCLRTRKLNHYAALVALLRANTRYRHFRLLTTTRLWRAKRYLVLCSNDPASDDSLARRALRNLHV